MNIRQNEPLNRHTTLRVGGPARFFAEATLEGELSEALTFARKKAVDIFVLGGGSNILVNDNGFPGLVLKVCTRGVKLLPAGAECVELVAEAGEEWDAMVGFAVEQGLFGLENMSLIPGTVGGAVVGNIGAYGAEVKDTLVWAEAMDRRTGTVRRFQANECDFHYRHSFFKTAEGRNFIVTRAAFSLKKNGSVNLRYKEVQDYFSLVGTRSTVSPISSSAPGMVGTRSTVSPISSSPQDLAIGTGAARPRLESLDSETAHPRPTPALKEVRQAIIAIRERKLPALTKLGTAGSFFKNPVIPAQQYEALAARYPGLPGHLDAPGKVKVPLGWVLDKICHLKGFRKGPVGTHTEQALVIVNEGGTAADIEAFANHIAATVKDLTGLSIEWEVEKV